jgi:hypothetical protein
MDGLKAWLRARSPEGTTHCGILLIGGAMLTIAIAQHDGPATKQAALYIVAGLCGVGGGMVAYQERGSQPSQGAAQ